MRRTVALVIAALLVALTQLPASVGATSTCFGFAVNVNGPTGTNGPDVLMGLPAGEAIDAKAGRDRVCADAADSEVKGGNGNDEIAIEAHPAVAGLTEVFGDGLGATAAGADRIVVRRDAHIAAVYGDGKVTGGAADTIMVAGHLTGGVLGDSVVGGGAPDVIGILPAGDVGMVAGDLNSGHGGRDRITIVGKAAAVAGDLSAGRGGNDTIAITNGSSVAERTGSHELEGWVVGDASQGDGGNDFMIIRGAIEGGVMGDHTGGDGGKDFIRIYPAAVIDRYIAGDGGNAHVAGYAAGSGGNDTIVAWPGASIASVYGDLVFGDGGHDRFSIGATVTGGVTGDGSPSPGGSGPTGGNGGNDTIGIGASATVTGWVTGDSVGGNGGDDVIDVSGTVLETIAGDSALFGAGGDDLIFVRAGAGVGPIMGDNAAWGGSDRIVVNAGAIVAGSIEGDGGIEFAEGSDEIIISGTVFGNVTGGGGQAGYFKEPDTITVNPAGVVHGHVFLEGSLGPGGEGDTLIVKGLIDGEVECSGGGTIFLHDGGVITGSKDDCTVVQVGFG